MADIINLSNSNITSTTSLCTRIESEISIVTNNATFIRIIDPNNGKFLEIAKDQEHPDYIKRMRQLIGSRMKENQRD